MATELFNPAEKNSIVRRTLELSGEINLQSLEIEPFVLTPDYITRELKFTLDAYARQIRGAIEPIAEEAEHKGYSANVYTALYEALLNAFQHGNKRDTSKIVRLSHRFHPESLDAVVMDEGGVLNQSFSSFVLAQKSKQLTGQMLSFYEFTGTAKPAGNNGTGTSFMHTYVDEVRYFKAPTGGLAVFLRKRRPPHNI